MRIKLIADGYSGWDRFIRRWGISFLIGEDVLFDTFGDPGIFLDNVKRLNIDLSKIRHIVISHDHWDHISGLWSVIDRYKDVAVYVCPHTRPEIKEKIASFGVRVVDVPFLSSIEEGIFSSGEIRGVYAGEDIFEQALVIKFLKRLAVVVGCAHPGIINIVDKVKEHFTKERIYLVLGGLHLKDASRPELNDTISALRARGVSKIAPMHCTGTQAVELIRKEYGIDFLEAGAGSVFEV
ncbi:MAG: MBL fold metallo-hydrolase [Candidatus Omnitrophica bacterium]|nr:MBL fold metallo-hydrolase [Candidatus Omnitrophota bacterium]MDD5574931.1 MBL fold metallo-hydrolase [Candidatus Omnitrophota bacterium]